MIRGDIDGAVALTSTSWFDLIADGRDTAEDYDWFEFEGYGMSPRSNGLMVSRNLLAEDLAGLMRAVNRATMEVAGDQEGAVGAILGIDNLVDAEPERAAGTRHDEPHGRTRGRRGRDGRSRGRAPGPAPSASWRGAASSSGGRGRRGSSTARSCPRSRSAASEPRTDPAGRGDAMTARLLEGGLVLVGDERWEEVSLLIEGGRIAALPPAREAVAGGRTVDVSDRLIGPGLVNGHTHPHGALGRGGVTDDAVPETSLSGCGRRVAARTPGEVRLSAELSAVDLIRKGCRARPDLLGEGPCARGGSWSARFGRSLTAHLDALGVLSPRFSGAHGVWLDDEEIAWPARHDAGVSHAPMSNLRPGPGIAPVRRLVDAGVTAGVGTDASNTSEGQNTCRVMHLAATLSSAHAGDPAAQTSAGEAFGMATAGSARLLGLDHVGRIAPGRGAAVPPPSGVSLRPAAASHRPDRPGRVRDGAARGKRGGGSPSGAAGSPTQAARPASPRPAHGGRCSAPSGRPSAPLRCPRHRPDLQLLQPLGGEGQHLAHEIPIGLLLHRFKKRHPLIGHHRLRSGSSPTTRTSTSRIGDGCSRAKPSASHTPQGYCRLQRSFVRNRTLFGREPEPWLGRTLGIRGPAERPVPHMSASQREEVDRWS